MSTKGYPSQKKLIAPLAGVTDKSTKEQFGTFQQNYSDKVGQDVVSNGYYRLTAAITVTTASTAFPKRTFTSTAHGGAIGDMVRFESLAANPGFEAIIIDVPDADTIVLGSETPANIVATNGFFILRSVSARLDASGATISVSASAAPIQFSLNGTDTTVSQDTGTPANSRPLPTRYLNTIGVTTDLSTLAEQQTQTTAMNAINTAVQIMDDWDESDRAKVNLIVGQAGVAAGSGGVTASTQRVTLATDVALPAGTAIIGALSANQSTNISQMNGVTVSMASGTSDTGTQRVTLATNVALPAGTAIIGALSNNQSTNISQMNGVTVSMASGTSDTGTQRVTLATDVALPAGTAIIGALSNNQSTNISQMNAVTVLMGVGPSGTGTQRVTIANVAAATAANVTSSASNVTLLASAAGRMGATFYNDSTAILYLKLSATASTTSYTVQLQSNGYYELPGGGACFSGIIDGIWSSANGFCRVTSW